ncbi:hypothetical protein Tco_1219221 [Tanacetum coccineum]
MQAIPPPIGGWVRDTTAKLNIPPPPELLKFDLLAPRKKQPAYGDSKKRKRINFDKLILTVEPKKVAGGDDRTLIRLRKYEQSQQCSRQRHHQGFEDNLKISSVANIESATAGARAKDLPKVTSNFRPLVADSIFDGVNIVAYKLELLEELSRVHNTFHVSNLKKCYADEPLAVPLDGLHFDDKLQFVEEPVEIMDREVKRLKRSRIPIIKVRWNSRRGPEFTWEREDQFRKKYPHLFTKTAPSSSAAS